MTLSLDGLKFKVRFQIIVSYFINLVLQLFNIKKCRNNDIIARKLEKFKIKVLIKNKMLLSIIIKYNSIYTVAREMPP